MNRKLGLIPGSEPLKFGAIELDKYVDPAVAPDPPATLTVPAASVYQWGMLGNDRWGTCVEAAMFHMDEVLYLKRGLWPYPYQTPQCIELYSVITGFNPNAPSTDNGTDPSAAMQYWVTDGLPWHRISGFGVLPANSPNIRRAVWEFGTAMYAVLMPVGAQSQGVHWRGGSIGQPGSWGGHGVAAGGYTPDTLEFISWGEEGDMDNAFAGAYLEQVLVPLSPDAFNKGSDVGPAGFHLAQMQSDLRSLR